jgi:hypothetical protein
MALTEIRKIVIHSSSYESGVGGVAQGGLVEVGIGVFVAVGIFVGVGVFVGVFGIFVAGGLFVTVGFLGGINAGTSNISSNTISSSPFPRD